MLWISMSEMLIMMMIESGEWNGALTFVGGSSWFGGLCSWHSIPCSRAYYKLQWRIARNWLESPGWFRQGRKKWTSDHLRTRRPSYIGFRLGPDLQANAWETSLINQRDSFGDIMNIMNCGSGCKQANSVDRCIQEWEKGRGLWFGIGSMEVLVVYGRSN